MNSTAKTSLDSRLYAYRDDLADARLQGKLDVQNFVEPWEAVVVSPIADLRSKPDKNLSITNQLLYGQTVSVFEQLSDWSWVQSRTDGYVGYVETDQLGFENHQISTHNVCVPSTFIYPQAELRAPIVRSLSMGSAVQVVGEATTRGTKFCLLENGNAMIACHLRRQSDFRDNYVEVAEALINVPYLWGGASGFGIDCSALVQLAMAETGKNVPRDSDMQAKSIGISIDPGNSFEHLRRGDLVFWNGHVAIVQGDIDSDIHIIHANGNTMSVASEALVSAISRIAYLYGQPTGFRRP